MTRDDYEKRRRQLDAELRAGIELLESSHRLQVRALDLAWMMLSREGVELAGPPPYTAPSPEEAAAATPPETARSPRRITNILDDLDAVLPRLPEEFDRTDVLRELGFQPERSTLYRALRVLVEEGTLTIAQSGAGKVPTRYRRPPG